MVGKRGLCVCVCKQDECYMDMRVIVLVMKNGERAGWVFLYFCFRDEKWMRDLKAMKAVKAESQQLCRCCWLGRCGMRCGWCDCGVGTGWPRECVRMLVDMVFECKGLTDGW